MNRPDPRFLLINYAPGAVGKFLMCVLTNSVDVAHLDPEIEKSKPNNTDQQLDYIRRHFLPDLWNWIGNEPRPSAAWGLFFVSPKYDRGNNLTLNEFKEKLVESCNDYFWQCVEQGKSIPMVWHRKNIPEFYKDAKRINIIVDPRSLKWVRRALWSKHYHYDYQQQVGLDQNHNLNLMPESTREIAKQFPVLDKIPLPFREFYRSRVIDFFGRDHYTDPKNFSGGINVNLSDILDGARVVSTISYLAKALGLQQVDERFVSDAHQYWKSLHPFHDKALKNAG